MLKNPTKQLLINPMETRIFNPEINERIDIYLADALGFTRSKIKNLIDNKKVLYNGEIVTKSGIILKGGEIKVIIEKETEISAHPQDLPINIIYQDNDIAIINKAQGMVTHPSTGSPENTLVNEIMHHIKDLSRINGILRPGIVHRLDKDTSGLLIIAKNNQAHISLAKQIEKTQVGRYYRALVVGNIKEEEGSIDTFITRSPKNRKLMAVGNNTGRRAITHFKVLERFIDYTYVEFKLQTGRTHQIRVHAKYINHPIVGDISYGKKDNFGLNGQLLHAYRLSFKHPSTNEEKEFIAPLPDYFENVLIKLRNKSN